ncbi:MAG TPA: peptide ABC transporter substrate-binding protein, partial [Patescibacteria group bacterium]|nr:peptide ABC transporter substrate-binding protein [Patescibacteria group bacterium]
PRFLSKKEKNIMRLTVAALIICLGLLVYFFVSSKLVDKPAKGGVYAENVVGFPQNINPLYDLANEVDRDLVKLVFAGLLKENNNGELVADLAKEWFVDESKTKYTLKLKDDVYWPDEEKFTSQDVVFTIEAIQNPAYQSPLNNNWTGITVSALDENTVQFTLPSPYETFLDNLTVGILPMHLWQEIMPENATLAELNLKPVGLGPYKFDSFVKDKQGYIKSYTLVRNDNYHFSAPYIEQITFKFQPTFEAAVDSLKNRNADGLSYLPQNLKEFLNDRKDLNYYSISLPQYTAIFFNQTKNPALADKRVRQALNLSIKKSKIVEEILGKEGVAINGLLLPGMPGYEENATEEFNVDEAKKLLADAGWQKKEIKTEENQATSTIESDGSGWSKFLFKDNQELTVQLTTTDQPQSTAIGELVQKYWQAIGAKVNLNTVEVGKIQKEVITERNFEALMFGEILGDDLDLYPFWHSSAANNQGLNIANFRNDKADKLLETIRKATTNEEKAQGLKELQSIIKDEAPAIFLYNPKYTYVVADKIKGINLVRIVSPADRLNGIADWYIKTKKWFK